ncbi:MAG: squalene/phytoene synthase family protein [Anaerolineae bacterium]
MMNANLLTWEKPLLDWAHEGLEAKGEHTAVACDADRLAAAYDRCEEITREHSRTFYLASGLLSPEKRRAARALYAFCRVTDDLIDHGGGDGLTRLIEWRRCALSIPPGDDPVALAWADTRAHYRIPQAYPEQLIAGVARDATAGRYETFADLAAYCYGVASTVGLMAMHIIGYAGREAIPYAVKLGVALQLTNILRDVGEDWRAGRLYLPLAELNAYGLTEEDIARGRVDARWRAFMQFQIARTRQFYAEAMPGIALLDASGRFAIAAAAELYRAILDDIEAHDYDVFSRRAHVNTIGKLVRLPGIWRRSRQNKPAAYA